MSIEKVKAYFASVGLADRILEFEVSSATVALAIAEIQPDRAIMVGDRTGDIRAGKANALPTIAAAFGYGNAAEWSEADATAYSMEELQTLLLNFVKA